MKWYTPSKKTKVQMSSIFVVAGTLFLFALSIVAPLHRASAAAQTLCYDALAGATTNCPNKTGFPIDGKPGANFVAGKCYLIADVSKGWITSDCNQNFFKVVVPIQTQDPAIDKATDNTCPTDADPTHKCNLVAQFLNPIINGLSIAVVLAVIISIIIGGIQYSASADQPGALAAARGRIISAVVAFVCYLFLWAFLQWVIPGGIL